MLTACGSESGAVNTDPQVSSPANPVTNTPTEMLSSAPTSIPTEFPVFTSTPAPTEVPVSTPTPEPTATATPTPTEAPTSTPAPTPTEVPHEHSYAEAVTVEATCISTGIKTFTCTCGDSYTEELPFAEHTVVTDNAIAATCTASGLTEGSHCSVCNAVLTAQTEVPATGHKYGTYTSDKNATFTADGTKTAVCSGCGSKDTVVDSGSKRTYTFTSINASKYVKSDADVFSTPSKSETPLGTLSKHEVVGITGKCNEAGLYRIDYNGATAYVDDSYFIDLLPAEACPYELDTWYDMDWYFFKLVKGEEEARKQSSDFSTSKPYLDLLYKRYPFEYNSSFGYAKTKWEGIYALDVYVTGEDTPDTNQLVFMKDRVPTKLKDSPYETYTWYDMDWYFFKIIESDDKIDVHGSPEGSRRSSLLGERYPERLTATGGHGNTKWNDVQVFFISAPKRYEVNYVFLPNQQSSSTSNIAQETAEAEARLRDCPYPLYEITGDSNSYSYYEISSGYTNYCKKITGMIYSTWHYEASAPFIESNASYARTVEDTGYTIYPDERVFKYTWTKQ